MRKLFLLLFACLISSFVNAQGKDAILGEWENPTGEGRIQIFKQDGQYFGKIYWLQEPLTDGIPKEDRNNPDPSKRSRRIKDLIILTGFTYSGKNMWSGGKIYDPKSGKTYNCKMNLKDANRLSIRGYLGISLFGRSETWTRVE